MAITININSGYKYIGQGVIRCLGCEGGINEGDIAKFDKIDTDMDGQAKAFYTFPNGYSMPVDSLDSEPNIFQYIENVN